MGSGVWRATDRSVAIKTQLWLHQLRSNVEPNSKLVQRSTSSGPDLLKVALAHTQVAMDASRQELAGRKNRLSHNAHLEVCLAQLVFHLVGGEQSAAYRLGVNAREYIAILLASLGHYRDRRSGNDRRARRFLSHTRSNNSGRKSPPCPPSKCPARRSWSPASRGTFPCGCSSPSGPRP